MSTGPNPLRLDYVLAVDPGYATQGVCLLGGDGTLRELFSSVTGASLDLHKRCLWQLEHVRAMLQALGPNGLLVIEEYHSSQGSRVAPEAGYRRGWYDGLVRELVMPLCLNALTVHAAKVWQWSETHRRTEHVGGKKKWIKPTATQIFNHVVKQHPWLKFPWRELDRSRLWIRHELRQKGDSIESAEKSLIHPTDALVMAVMGYVACVQPDLRRGLSGKQQVWVHEVRDTYNFQEGTETGNRQDPIETAVRQH